MKKIEMSKNVRVGITIVLIVGTIISLLILYQAYKLPDVINEDIVVTKYSQLSNFGYTVNLNSDKLYDVGTIVGTNPNQTYFSKIVRNVSTVFTYKFDSSASGTNIQGNYDITAVLSTDTWEKKFVLVPNREFKGTNEVNFVENAAIDINYYNNILTNISKDIDVQPKDSKLMLIYNINAVVTKDGKQATESFVPIITITSTKGAFNVKGDISKKNDDVIKRTESNIRLDTLEKRTTFTIITVILVFITIVFFVITKNRKEKINKTEKKVQDIKKKYGDMIICSNGSGLPDAHIHHKVTTGSIEDLVKAAEQLDEPIIVSGMSYYVYDGSTMYIYIIEES